MSRIYVDEILPKDASKISMPDAELPAGSVVQVVNTVLTEAVTWTGNTNIQNILSATITPKYSTSKILVQCSIQLAAQDNMNNIITLTMDRNGTKIAKNTSPSSSTANNQAWGSYGGPWFGTSGRIQETFVLNYLDSPNTSNELVYWLGARLDNAANTAYVGRWSLNNDSANNTTITLMEIKQ